MLQNHYKELRFSNHGGDAVDNVVQNEFIFYQRISRYSKNI